MTTQTDDLIEMAKQGYFTVMLDEQLRVLEPALEDDGFKVVLPPQGLKDNVLKMKAKARGWAILTRNSKDFVDDAVRYDYDVIAIEAIRFIDDKQDRTNATVQKISAAIRRSRIAVSKGNFCLTIRDDGSFHMVQLV
jgi:hypothetical protein